MNRRVADLRGAGATSEGDLSAFVQNHLMPAFAKHQIPPPSVAIYPTHKVLAYKAVDEFQV